MTVQALARRRFGLRRPPVVTAVVFAVTAATSVLGLLLPGVLAEQVVGAPRWLACYFGAGLAGELAGYAWQPRGAGNSVAICGLAGAVTVALAVEARVPRLAPVALAYWCAALLGAHWGPAS